MVLSDCACATRESTSKMQNTVRLTVTWSEQASHHSVPCRLASGATRPTSGKRPTRCRGEAKEECLRANTSSRCYLQFLRGLVVVKLGGHGGERPHEVLIDRRTREGSLHSTLHSLLLLLLGFLEAEARKAQVCRRQKKRELGVSYRYELLGAKRAGHLF